MCLVLLQVTDTLVDGELVIDHAGELRIPRYLIYDVISFRGQVFATIPEMRDYLTRLVVAKVSRTARACGAAERQPT